MNDPEKVIPFQDDEEFRREIDEIQERGERELRNKIERQRVRLQLWARKCLQHAECCELKPTQIEFLEGLSKSREWFELREERIVKLGAYWSAYPRPNIQKASRIWQRITNHHVIETEKGTIEWELEKWHEAMIEKQRKEIREYEQRRLQP